MADEKCLDYQHWRLTVSISLASSLTSIELSRCCSRVCSTNFPARAGFLRKSRHLPCCNRQPFHPFTVSVTHELCVILVMLRSNLCVVRDRNPRLLIGQTELNPTQNQPRVVRIRKCDLPFLLSSLRTVTTLGEFIVNSRIRAAAILTCCRIHESLALSLDFCVCVPNRGWQLRVDMYCMTLDPKIPLYLYPQCVGLGL